MQLELWYEKDNIYWFVGDLPLWVQLELIDLKKKNKDLSWLLDLSMKTK